MTISRRHVAVSLFSLLVVGELFAADPVVVASGDSRQAPKQPQVAVSSDGTVHLVYGVGDAVFHVRSTDGGKTFPAPREAFRCANLSLGMRRGPRIAVTEQSVVVSAIGGQQGKGRDGDLQTWRSADGGETWEGPLMVNDSPDAAREGLHGMAAGGDGSVWCVWLDLRGKRSEVYASQSTDGGQSWSKNIRVYRSPDGSVCECCHPSIAVDAAGKIHVLFRNSLDGNRDMYLATSQDGKVFAPARKLGTGSWDLAACPMDGGMLAVDDRGKIVTVWRRKKDVFSAVDGTAKEQSVGSGEQPWIAATNKRTVIVWSARRDGDLWVRGLTAGQPVRLATAARDPVVAAGPAGAGPLIVCWEGKHDGRPAVCATALEVEGLDGR